MKKILLGLWIFIFPTLAQATIHTAASTTRAAFITALSGLTDGDRIILPAGSSTWTQQVDITACISITGAGVGLTNITDNITKDGSATSHLFEITCNSPNYFRWTNFTIIGQATDPSVYNKGHVNMLGTTTTFRVDHLSFTTPQTSGFHTDSCVYGVFDHITWVTDVFSTFFLENIPQTCGGEAYGDYSWHTAIDWGGPGAIYVEDSTFTATYGGSTPGAVLDGLGGQRTVFRHNTVSFLYIGSHGTDSGLRIRGSRQLEVYENDFTFPTDVGLDFLVWIRGGTGVVYNNTVHGVAPGSMNYLVKSLNCRDTGAGCAGGSSSFAPWDACDGTSPYDQNIAGQTGYICVDQPGAGTSNDLLGAAIPTAAWVGNTSDPIYIWNNVTDVAPHYTGGSIHVIENRDYFICADSSCARPGYTAYTYPHPLQGYFVSTTGSDSNAGTITSPFLTVEHGALQMTCGDTLFIRGGIYNGQIGGFYNDVPHCLSFSSAITIEAYQSESVTLTCTGSCTGDSIFGLATNIVDLPLRRNFYWILRNITFDGNHTTPFAIGGLYGDYVRLDTVEVKNATGSGILPHGAHWEFLNVRAHDNGSNLGDHGLYITGYSNLVDGGEYDHNYGYGIQYQGSGDVTQPNSDNNIVKNAKIHDNYWGVIFSGGSGDTAYNNLIYNNTSEGISNAGSGFCVDCALYNNTITGNGLGISLGYTVGDPCSDGGSIRSVVKNNIVYGNGTYDIDVRGGFNAVLTNNLVGVAIHNTGCNTTTTGTITGNPLFTGAAPALTLQAGSPAIAAGVNLSAVFTTDFTRATRPVPFDDGAYAYGALATATLDVVTPASAIQGTSVVLSFTGINTNWIAGTSVCSLSGSGITINFTSVTTPTEAICSITLASNAVVSARTVTMTTVSEVVSKANGFTVVIAPQLTTISPTGGVRSATVAITLTGTGTHWVNATSVCSLSGTGITINSTTISGSTAGVCNISIAAGATLSLRDVTVTTGAEVVTKSTSFLVDAPVALSISPSVGIYGTSLTLTLTGVSTSWANGVSVCSFSGTGITVNSTLVLSATSAQCNISVSAAAALTARDITMTTSSEVETLPNGFTVVAGGNSRGRARVR